MGRRLRMVEQRTRPEAQPVRKVEKRVYRVAEKLADGDRHRIEITGDNEIVVHNRPDWRVTEK